MEKNITSSIRKYFPKPIKLFIKYILHCFNYDTFFRKSYSQEGEDMVLLRLFEQKKHGFYVDVGAHHPKRFSNTFLFYKLGWKGINIDAMPGSMNLFCKQRPRDINLETPISKEATTLTYFEFNEPALNGFDETLSLARARSTNYRIVSRREIATYTLKEVLGKYLPENQEVDFLSVDVEGLDLEVLESNDWSIFRPKAILVEVLKGSLNLIESDPVYILLNEKNYCLYAKTVNTCFFLSKEFLAQKINK